MNGKFIKFALLTVVSAAALVATGCANGPSALTGSDQAEMRQRARWTDDKGHYRPDLEMRGSAPLHNIAD